MCAVHRRIHSAEDCTCAGAHTLTRIRQRFLQPLDAMLQRSGIARLPTGFGQFVEDAQRVLRQSRDIAFALRKQLTKVRIALRRRRLRFRLLGVSCHER
jgi:hypothetical protein